MIKENLDQKREIQSQYFEWGKRKLKLLNDELTQEKERKQEGKIIYKENINVH